jgi:hypothetical protein
MKETEMGNRGSKSSVSTGRKAVHISEFVRTVVKEQRVYGGCMELNGSILRCTLMDLKKDYQNRILSKYKKKKKSDIILHLLTFRCHPGQAQDVWEIF